LDEKDEWAGRFVFNQLIKGPGAELKRTLFQQWRKYASDGRSRAAENCIAIKIALQSINLPASYALLIPGAIYTRPAHSLAGT